MNSNYFEEVDFKDLDFAKKPLSTGDYDGCTFTACNLAGADLSGFNFMDCEFTGCNFSLAKLVKTGLKGVRFKDCKLVGLRFDDCSEFNFEVRFEGCTLHLSSFYSRQLKKTVFKNCLLHETDFTDANLSGATFDQCDLHLAVFENTMLESADLSTAFHYTINPVRNRVKKARFSMPGVLGLLQSFGVVVV